MYWEWLILRGSKSMRGVQGSSKRRLRLLLLLLLLPSSLVHVSVTEGATVNVPLHLI